MDEERFTRFEMAARDVRDLCRLDPAGCSEYRVQILAAAAWVHAALEALNEYQEHNRRAA